jgi:uncharacterized protein (DUF488 family)
LIYTIGYGGRSPQEFLKLLVRYGVRAIADVRLRPDRAAMGCYTLAKSADRGIQRLLKTSGIHYFSFVELGNVFLDFEDWRERYTALLERAGDLLTERLINLPRPVCLLCAEKLSADCHRLQIAEWLTNRGHHVKHIGDAANPE